MLNPKGKIGYAISKAAPKSLICQREYESQVLHKLDQMQLHTMSTMSFLMMITTHHQLTQSLYQKKVTLPNKGNFCIFLHYMQLGW